MEGRIRNFLLKLAVCALFLLPTIAYSVEIEGEQELKPVIEPEITRSKFVESNIKTSDFEVIASAGVISIEDFGSNPALALKLNYHISDDFFVGGEWTMAKGEETSFEVLSGGAPLLSDDDRELNTYLLTLGYNAFPGEAFLTDNVTYNTSFYVIGGLGKTSFAGDDHSTFSIGAGYRILVGNFLSVYVDFRDNIFNADIFGKDKSTHNLLFTAGAGFYF